MPTVKFPYTKRGKALARKARAMLKRRSKRRRTRRRKKRSYGY